MIDQSNEKTIKMKNLTITKSTLLIAGMVIGLAVWIGYAYFELVVKRGL